MTGSAYISNDLVVPLQVGFMQTFILCTILFKPTKDLGVPLRVGFMQSFIVCTILFKPTMDLGVPLRVGLSFPLFYGWQKKPTIKRAPLYPHRNTF